MLELLKKFEEESTEMDALEGGEEDDDDLSIRLQDVDLSEYPKSPSQDELIGCRFHIRG